MTWHNKVMWTEGMFLQPQHFQQQERHLHWLLQTRVSQVAAFGHGFSKLVLAQDTGGAIVGAVRADYFTGWGDDAYTLAAGLKQPLQMWALWPRQP